MLKRIQITNFKCHEALTLDFGLGLIAIRGAVEKGKSSLLQAVAYALFGTKALPYSLEDTVTYGKPVSTLKVVLDFVVDGVDYTISRGKSGAEINYAGGSVTGQTETASYIGKLLGTDAQAAPKLILANQNEIRGALAAGTKATTELIEKLAEFDQLDNLIDLIQAKLVTGSTAAAEAAVESAQVQMDNLGTMEQPDMAALREQELVAEKLVSLGTQLVATATTEHREATAALANAKEVNADIRRAKSNIEAANERLAKSEAEFKAIKVPKAPAATAIQKQEAIIREGNAALALEDVYKAVKPALGLEPLYEGTFEQLEQEIDSLRKRSSEWKMERVKLTAAIETTLALKVAGSCTLCGKDVSEVAEVVAKNDELEAKAALLKKEADSLGGKVAQALKDEAELVTIRSKSKTAVNLANKYAKHLDIDASVTPPLLKWPGAVSFEAVEKDVAAALEELAELKQALDAHKTANARKEQALKAVEASKQDLDHAVTSLGGREEIDLSSLQRVEQEREQAVRERRENLDKARAQLEQRRSHNREAVAKWESYLKLRSQVEGTLSKAKEDLRVLQFNNTLLKAVRTARPVIADKLWALVLGAVSKYFSDMRGNRSLVTKTPDGFVVDGHNAATLSGSTLDILGLAVRVALVKTFVPHAPLLVLDEPTAAMDVERTATTLGFLTQTGFKQTIIVSHEEATEAVADHLIQL
jgi:exonuclease SbcC